MILSRLFWAFKRIDEKTWIKEQENKLLSKYSSVIDELEKKFDESLKKKEDELRLQTSTQYEVEQLNKRLEEKKIDLEKKNEELRQQIRVIEAKASPDKVWESSFSLGFSKAWDMMVPIMMNGMEKVKTQIKNSAHEDAMKGIEPAIQKRINSIQGIQIKQQYQIFLKIQDLKSRIENSDNNEEKNKLQNYIEAIEWVTNGNN